MRYRPPCAEAAAFVKRQVHLFIPEAFAAPLQLLLSLLLLFSFAALISPELLSSLQLQLFGPSKSVRSTKSMRQFLVVIRNIFRRGQIGTIKSGAKLRRLLLGSHTFYCLSLFPSAHRQNSGKAAVIESKLCKNTAARNFGFWGFCTTERRLHLQRL